MLAHEFVNLIKLFLNDGFLVGLKLLSFDDCLRLLKDSDPNTSRLEQIVLKLGSVQLYTSNESSRLARARA